ncbi:late embryogenesis abundant protein At1g64065-like [Salvia hispanica]|uniref:late embryogenesis abundant protein At1g64065-like n=1 Tax=Salvia hispanica TaxID=49212 RepID=UPI0020099BB5|nr:late embryogenesis abundant protein At1g64065-like [Salvia hispanica]
MSIFVDRVLPESCNNSTPRVNPPTTGERWQCCCIVTTIIVIAAGIIIDVVMLPVKTPKLGMVGAMLTSLSVGTPQNPWLQADITAELAVNNPNFVPYDYRNTTLDFFYEGAMVGQVPIPASGVAKRSTKTMILIAPLFLNAAELSADLSLGVVRITSSAGMRGRVIGTKRSTNYLICVMQIVTATQSITNLLCQ